MPRPAYVILSKSGSVDQYSNSVSIFDVIDSYHVIKQSKHTKLSLRVIAAWLREDKDRPIELFQGQIACIAPDDTELFVGNCEDFAFTQPIYRWNSEFAVTGFTQIGIHLIEARLRRFGEQAWMWRQTFPFLVQAQEQSVDTAESSKRNNTNSQGPVKTRGNDNSLARKIDNSDDIERLAGWLFFAAIDGGSALSYNENDPAIKMSDATALLLALDFTDAAMWAEKGDIDTVRAKINSLAEVVDKDQIKKIKDANVAKLLTSVLKAKNDELEIEVFSARERFKNLRGFAHEATQLVRYLYDPDPTFQNVDPKSIDPEDAYDDFGDKELIARFAAKLDELKREWLNDQFEEKDAASDHDNEKGS